MISIKAWSRKIYGEYLIRNYSIKSKYNNLNAVISYLPFPFWLSKNSIEMRKHQNRREAIAIAEIFKEFGFNVDIVFFGKKIFLPSRNYRVVFGLEPNFERFAKRNPNAIKIYYATGSYWEYQNSSIISRTREINRRRNSKLAPSRLVIPHNSVELADWIIQIGSTFTIKTYPFKYRKKVKLIRQSSFEFLEDNIKKKNYVLAKNNFFWFGGKGAILKGLDLLLEAFKIKQDFNLYIAGEIESDFMKEYSKELFETKNIHYLGWLDVASDKLREIANSCAYVILPSVSEGGMPGSIISMMRLGLLPIVSYPASYDGIEEFGFIISQLTVDNIIKIINRISQLDTEDIINRSRRAQEFAKTNFNLNTFRTDLKKALSNIFLHSKSKKLKN